MDEQQLLDLAGDVGFALLKSGGEIYRVEESIRRIFLAYGQESGDAFVIPSVIIVSFTTPQGRSYTKMLRVRGQTVDLERVERLNSLCRKICLHPIEPEAVRRELESIEGVSRYGYHWRMAAYAMVAFFFTLLFAGTAGDAVAAGLCGLATCIACEQMNRFHTNSFFVNTIASAIIAAMALGAVNLGLGTHYDRIIIGALMNLVPGVMITNFMRDIIAGDLLAGLIKLTESLLVATAIALGAGIILTAARLLWGIG